MKKLITVLVVILAMRSVNASPVSVATAQKVATNLFSQVSPVHIGQVTLAYTETDSAGDALYYVFNINAKDGFVIISGDDILHPVIGYSTESRPYAIPNQGTTIAYFMQKRKAEIITCLTNKVTASPDITNEWTAYINNTAVVQNTHRAMNSSVFPSSTAYLVQSTWDQESPYYDDCPGTSAGISVTGCVATAMCQIMRYWEYPAIGQGASSYCDCTSHGYSDNWGTLSANYAHGYPWSAMTLNAPSVTDTTLARAMNDAGISVEMDYDPNGSGAYVITSDDPAACAQISYVKYFKYYSKILDGLNEFSNSTAWQDTLEHELNCSRPIQYVGSDPVEGGHTWVCDGYDAGNNFHMNWGWSGLDNGWYSLNNLNPNTLNFSKNLEALIGIMPPPVTAAPVAEFSSPEKVCSGNYVQFMDISTNQPTSWKWTFTGGIPDTSTLQDPAISYSTPGTYPVKLVVANGFGSDSITTVSYITVYPEPTAPVIKQSNDSLICIPSDFVTYEWDKNSTDIGSTPQIVATTNGVYRLTVYDSNGCSASVNHIVSTAGINEISLNNFVKVYPNPTQGNIQVLFDMPVEGDYTISVTNVLGQTMFSGNAHIVGQYTQTIDLSACSKGVYFLSVIGENSKGIQKILLY